MPDFSTLQYSGYQPSGLTSAVTGGVFYVLVAIALFFSAMTIYALIKYSDSKAVAFIATVIYCIIFLTMVSTGIHALSLIG